MPAYKWICSIKDKTFKQKCPIYEVSNHPLKQDSIHLLYQKSDSSILDKINSITAAFESDDPLLTFAQENMNMEENDAIEDKEKNEDFLKSWNTRKSQILHKYTTIDKLSIVSSYLPHDDKVPLKHITVLNEHVKSRLEQLDSFEEGTLKKTIGLSQQEFITKINILTDELKKAWKEEQRVKAFKIVIQCSKLLSDTSVIQFYPSKFILVADILDIFGDLVFSRLKEKCLEHSNKAKFPKDNIDPELVPEAAKDTCHNWLYKMASIRELLPRMCIEMALLRCYSFLSKAEFDIVLARLTQMIRGIGNPLVAIYLRMYLCRVTQKLPVTKNWFYDNLKEFLLVYKQIFEGPWKNVEENNKISLNTYLELYTPALDWLMRGAVHYESSQTVLVKEFLTLCSTIPDNQLLLCAVVSSFDSVSIANQTETILELVQSNKEDMILTHEILLSLGEHLCKVDVSRYMSVENLVQTWWKLSSNLNSMELFLKVLEPWMEIACTHLTTKHINFILRGTIKHLIKFGDNADDHANLLQAAVKRMVKTVPYVEEIFLMDAFMPLIELIQKSNERVVMAKIVVTTFFDRIQTGSHIVDHIVISGLMRLCCILHDSITALTVEDELKLIAEVVSKFVQGVHHHEDSEQQLNFYVECRAAFIKLDGVLITLVHAVNTLSCRTWCGARRRRACAAYCFVTVPSLRGPLDKAQLYLLCGQVALLHNCVGQAESFFKVFVGLIPSLPAKLTEDGQIKCTKTRVTALFTDFLSTILLLPDNIDSNCKAYVLSGFLKSLDRLPWTKTETVYYTTLLCALDLLANMKQPKYIYHIDSVLSNDKLYGSDEDFTNAVDNYATTICEELLIVLKSLGEEKLNQRQSNLTLELFWRVVTRGDLATPTMANLTVKLWTLSHKLPTTNAKLRGNILSALGEDRQTKIRQLLKNGDTAT